MPRFTIMAAALFGMLFVVSCATFDEIRHVAAPLKADYSLADSESAVKECSCGTDTFGNEICPIARSTAKPATSEWIDRDQSPQVAMLAPLIIQAVGSGIAAGMRDRMEAHRRAVKECMTKRGYTITTMPFTEFNAAGSKTTDSERQEAMRELYRKYHGEKLTLRN